MKSYDHKKIEKKWQKYWKENEINKTTEVLNKPKCYVLDMFPYPSGDGLHMGHTESYTATDIYYRYKKLKGFNVLHPQGFDSFGLPAENYAIKTGIHPKETTKRNIANYKKQMSSLGFGYDWNTESITSSPEYYKWTQWIFTKFFENNLVYKKTDNTNWCESCKTGLANEQVVDGKCERCKNEIVQKEIPSWFFKITDLAEDLINDLDKVDWPEHTKKNQKSWIGKSEGTLVSFNVVNVLDDLNDKKKDSLEQLEQAKRLNKRSDTTIEIFTTRIDTIFGCTYVVVAPEHPLVASLLKFSNSNFQFSNIEEVEKYLEQTKKKSELDRIEAKDKTGVELKGIKAINPFNGEEVPVFVADYVLGHYGTGAVMAVPAHDERDFEFAKKYNLPIKEVIIPNRIDKKNPPVPNKKTGERRNVHALVRNPETNKFLCLKSHKFNWVTFPMGGIEEGEDVVTAAKREVEEETGYKNLKLIQVLGGEVRAEYFAKHKDENRVAYTTGVMFDLVNEEKSPVEKEWANEHEMLWIDKDHVNYETLCHAEMDVWVRRMNGETVNTEDGVLIDSGEFSKLNSQEARQKMTAWLEEKKFGARKTNYRLRDWSVSRQRYWGAPIPIVYDPEGKAHVVPGKHLPWLLPEDVDFVPTGESPLKKSKEFFARTEKIFGKGWTPEVDTLDTFVCSSWYYLRYPDAKNSNAICADDKLKYWLPVDVYIGGAEHTYMHLLYARFMTKALKKVGVIDFDEPFKKLRHQGMVLDKNGIKMSKSKGNVVNPDDMVEKFGADAVRMCMMFLGPLEDDVMWNENSVVGVSRFLERVWKLQERVGGRIILSSTKGTEGNGSGKNNPAPSSVALENLLNKTIKKVTEDIESFKFNTAVSSLMILLNEMEKEKNLPITNYQLLITLLSPFAPHICEEIWNNLGHKKTIFNENWPSFDPKKIEDETFKLVVQVNGKMRDMFDVPAGISQKDAEELTFKRENVTRYIQGKTAQRVIFVPNKLINIVVN